jgi:RNA polymerase sigma factor (TIGR02999 family)
MPGADVTGLLVRAKSGDGEALGQVYELLYQELQGVARAQLNRVSHQTFNTVVLINESYLKLLGQNRVDVQNRSHFLAIAARAMRQILIDYFRRTSAEKRGGPQVPVQLAEDRVPGVQRDDTLLALDEALDRLQEHSERLARVVECKFFGGMTYEEIGEALDISPRTARKDWSKAKAWLTLELESLA